MVKFFKYIFLVLTIIVKPSRVNQTFAPIKLLDLGGTLAMTPSVKWGSLMVSPYATIFESTYVFHPISSKPQFTSILEFWSKRYEALNNPFYVTRDMSFHPFTWAMIHLYFLSYAYFSYPTIHFPFLLLFTSIFS